MATIDGSALPTTTAKCEKFRKALVGKKVDFNSTGSRENNALLNLLKCECKESKVCGPVQQRYAMCHKSVMGAGTFEGRNNCGTEMRELYDCWRDSK
jgi:hypothetical protein